MIKSDNLTVEYRYCYIYLPLKDYRILSCTCQFPVEQISSFFSVNKIDLITKSFAWENRCFPFHQTFNCPNKVLSGETVGTYPTYLIIPSLRKRSPQPLPFLQFLDKMVPDETCQGHCRGFLERFISQKYLI